jgi:hypothetical protein
MNELAWVCTDEHGCMVGPYENYYAAANTICQDQSDAGVCQGDSGGPAMIIRDGVEYVAGVSSYGAEGCRTYGCSVKVDAYQEWIEKNIGAKDGSSCSLDEDCASFQCQDGICCDQACSGACQSCRLPGSEGTCLPLTDGSPCGDDDLCNGQEVCLDGRCEPGERLVCQDDVECTRDLCDPKQGCVFKPSTLACFDDNPCTRESCHAELGCQIEPEADGTLCPEGTCQAGMCVAEPEDEGCATGGSSASGPLLALVLLGLAICRRRF